MSFNVAGIYVEATGASQADLVASITAYRTKRGAKPDAKSPLDIEELTLEDSDTTGRLGYAVSRPMRGTGPSKKETWFAIADTERYSADYGLAEHLAKKLGVRVLWYTLSGVTNDGAIRRLGPWKGEMPKDDYDAIWEIVSALPHTGLTFDELGSARARQGFALFGFKGVPVTSYRFGPPEKKSPGKTAQSAPSAIDLDRVAGQIEELFAEGKSEHAMAIATQIAEIPVVSFEALVDVAQYARCFSVNLSAKAPTKLVLALADAGLSSRTLSSAINDFVKKKGKHQTSLQRVSLAYVKALEAAAWSSDAKRFDAFARLCDTTNASFKSYVAESAEELRKKKKTEFADRLAALGARKT